MKTKKKNVYLFVLICFFTTLCAKAQLQNIDEIVRQDSLLFYQCQLNGSFLPTIPMDLGISCDSFLKEKETYDKRLKGTSRHRFLDETWSDLSEYRYYSNPAGSDDYELVLQDRWTPYKKKFRVIFKSKHEVAGNESVEKEALLSCIEKFGRLSVYKPLFYKTIEKYFHNNIKEYVDRLYETSMMCNKKTLRKFLRNPSRNKLNVDLGAQFSISVSMYEFWLANRLRISREKMPFFVCE